jgi:nucleotide-binding universal stress UspA family protein
MVGVDSSAASQKALEVAIALVRGIQSGQILLARVQLDPINETQDPVLTKAATLLKHNHITYKTFTAVGDAGTELVRLASEENADFLVMGSPDRRPTVARSLPDLDRLLGKSTSDYVRVNIECPVLMVRSQQDQD